jgi:drug/metabolite transporter (DMT)-like permease
VPLSALLLALAAALVHALWNLLLAGARDTQAATAVALVVAIVVFAPVAAVAWRADRAVWPYVAGSSAFELAYFALLAAAYARAELSLVYPLARGSAPVVVLVVGVVFLGVGASLSQVLGVVLVGGGVVLVRGRAPRRGLVLALAIGACIAGYTLIDKRGIRHANPVTYLELSMIVPSLAYAAAVTRTRGAAAARAAVTVASVAAGVAIFGAYALVLAALQRAPAASVAAVRETGVVLAALLAVPILHERVGLARVAGACVVVAGIAALAR